MLAVIYRPLVLECFDPQFLRSASSLSSPTHLIFLVLVVLNLVAGFQALGTLMAVGIMLLPAIAARFWAEDISAMVLIAVLIAFAASLSGLLLSYYANVPTARRSSSSPASLSPLHAARRARRLHLSPRSTQAPGSLIPQ
jgi:zinc/manganese transport system permease protein